MILRRMTETPEHAELPQVVTVGGGFYVTEQPYEDRLLWAWLRSEPITETADERIEADRRSTTRQMEVAFA